jgi:hypothetical protein
MQSLEYSSWKNCATSRCAYVAFYSDREQEIFPHFSETGIQTKEIIPYQAIKPYR